ncbi:type IV pilus twitching motility protein PilT [Trinickia soli]|jgi:twitching motility protein PilT|uniref:Twitching motility protein PilT n=1 Tax=Trinickia soli TaxID=380675 RepID=A0A2N7W4S1_9BURK|nr:ATPase, T2SS/T4P/T4SS family [Trinickia soli]KAA0079987.1 twitching motility protein PilT [Paraburkholderia sp. T12-10]PMS24393.1 twitching motility protein PilT [Trinickia soli]CAB3676077.1 Twitching mobility protein [Trinickia soli]
MTIESSGLRDLTREILALVDLPQTFTDIHIEQDRPIMIKTPQGWIETGDSTPVMMEEMRPMLEAIDEQWEARLTQGAIDRPFVLTRCRLRCNVYRSSGGRKTVISIRRLPLEPLPLEKLGLPAYIRTMLDATKGIVLVTGPTGSGKTTTIASLLDHINRTRNSHIVTIEEPIEFYLDSRQSIISQREVPTDTPSFSAGLREALRQKPDVIMVGEVRDLETAETVLQAGESGHLVFATMHINSAASTLSRLLSFFPSEQRERHAASLANSLIGAICQSLVPSEDGQSFVLASELLFNTNQQVSKLLVDPDKMHFISDFIRRKEDNMSRSLNEHLASLVARNAISARDAMRAAYNRMELHEMLLGSVKR